MGRLRSLAILLILGAWGAATEGAPPNDAAPPSTAPRPAAPVPPVQYLQAGARLFNSGQYAMASKYLSAAQTYRDQLTSQEQTVLDAYLREMAKAPADEAVAPAVTVVEAPAAPAQPPQAVVPAATAAAFAPPAQAQLQAPQRMQPQPQAAAPAVAAPATDTRQTAIWTLQSAREQIRMGNYDEASKLVAQAQSMNVAWGLFDDTPAKVAEAIASARPKMVAAPVQNQPRTHRAAKAKLKEARALLAKNEFEQAEAIALDVKSWNLSYSILDLDSPDKVAAAARALRRRDALRSDKIKDQPSQNRYDIMVHQARQLLAQGKLREAEAQARQAQLMNVVPALTSDRAEAVLHDIAMAQEMVKARQVAGVNAPPAPLAAAPPVPAPPSAVAEREANELLAKGDKAATAKFIEAERLRAQESGQPVVTAPAVAAMPGTTDDAILRVQGIAPADALAGNPAAAPPPLASPAPPPAQENRGEQLLAEARALYGNANYAAARQKATEAKASGTGVDAQADDLLAQVALAEQGGALSLYESALDAVRKNDYDRARALLTEVATLGNALDASLMQKVQDLLAKLPKADAGKAIASDLRPPAFDAESLAAQKLNAEVGTRIAEARRLQDIDPEKAIAIYETTLQAVKIKAPELPEGAARTMIRRLEVAIELAKKDKVAFDAKMKDKSLRAEIENKRLRIMEADVAKQGRMKELMDRATTAMANGNYQDAEKFAKMAQEVDPNEVAATILAWKANVQRHYKLDVEQKKAKEEGVLVAFQGVDAAAIPDPIVQRDSISFPTSFKDLTRERLRMNRMLEPRKDPKTLAIEAKLNDPVSLNMDNQPLAEAIGFLANYTGLNIVLDSKALTDVDITTATPVSLVASNIKLKTALKLLLKPLGLTYKVEDEVLEITNPQASMSSTYTKTYYVGDLILPPNAGKGPTDPMNPSNVPSPISGAKTNPNGLQAQTVALANGATSLAPNGAQTALGERPKVDMTPLIQLITATIAPATWRVNDPSGADVSSAYGLGAGFGAGGGADAGLDATTPIGSITPFFLSISLIIRHTAEIHDQVADLLRQLRRLQDLQVSIEVRFITLSDSFFEQIGVDFDFDIHSKTVGPKATFAVPNPAASLFPTANTGGLLTTTGSTAGTTGGVGGTTGGVGGSTGGVGGSTGGSGGTAGLGTTGGLGGLGGGAGGGSAGGLGGQNGGGLGGLGGTTSGGTGASTTPAPYIVNPFRDFSLGNRTPIVVGASAVGANGANFTPGLDIPFNQGSGGLIAPTNATPGAGATFGIAFLSDLEVYLFLTAAQGDSRSNILQAPKVTTFNGAAAFITNTEQINFIESLIPIVGPGSVAFLPNVSSFPNGVQLQVTPVVSADRRYVRMTLSPIFTVIEGFDTIQVPAAVGGSGLGGGSATVNGTIQLPRFNFTTVNTTVTVPDGGTVLLGGVKRLNEQRLEFGVPVLSKTPLLNRLFRNIGIGRQTSSLMLMVTPRIIILEEEEEKLGIPAVNP